MELITESDTYTPLMIDGLYVDYTPPKMDRSIKFK